MVRLSDRTDSQILMLIYGLNMTLLKRDSS